MIMNPVLELLNTHTVALRPAWLPHRSQCMNPDDYSTTISTALAAPTIPGLPNYLPPMKPSHLPMDDWLAQVAVHMSDSAYGFIADIWTSILSRKDPAITPSLFLLWNEQIPKPTPLTSLFWLFVCEVWPLLNSYPALATLLSRRHPSALPLSAFHPPQPFMIPMSQHYNTSGSRPSAPAHGGYQSPTHIPLGTLLSQNMTRADRERMSQMSIDHVPIYSSGLNNAVTLEDHILTPSGTHAFVRTLESGFVASRDMTEIGGHAHTPCVESTHHVDAIINLRRQIMSGLNVHPGLSTTISNVYGVPGGWIRCLSEDLFCVSLDPNSREPWGMNDERVKVNGKNIHHMVPNIMPRVWFGWTGTQRWLPQLDEFKPHFEWTAAYLQHRPTAIQLLFEPDRYHLREAKFEARSKRHDTLNKAGRFVSNADQTAAPTSALESAFKSLSPAFAAFK
ncbi:hypothetical protein Bpfe_031124 [Biomphalaria pfeifferi]|uniref:Uncharacterized protein n=1 Tax=Biomphalaria pfeifferi TaxID=112525 RepID=A0AAD8ANA5_BIOPF|nr:hypothetical protein Bpfe_031124 [Biomphalaria pfeifferi]